MCLNVILSHVCSVFDRIRPPFNIGIPIYIRIHRWVLSIQKIKTLIIVKVEDNKIVNVIKAANVHHEHIKNKYTTHICGGGGNSDGNSSVICTTYIIPAATHKPQLCG